MNLTVWKEIKLYSDGLDTKRENNTIAAAEMLGLLTAKRIEEKSVPGPGCLTKIS